MANKIAPQGQGGPALFPAETGEALGIYDGQAGFLYGNQAYLAMVREFSQVDLTPGTPFAAVLPLELRGKENFPGRRVLNGEETVLELIHARTDGEPAVYERLLSPMYQQGILCGFSEIIRQINPGRQRVAEEDLLESRERLSQIVQGSPIPTFVIDENHIITHWNKACAMMIGLSSAEMVGTRRQWQAFYLHERPVMADLVLDSAKEPRIAEFYAGKYRPSTLIEGAYEAEDFFDFGHVSKWLFFTAAPIRNRAGRIIGAIETLQDITDRKLMEEEVRRINDELEARVAERTRQLARTYEQLLHAEKFSAVGKLAASVAHEFGNPIIGIRNFLQSLRGAKLARDEAEMLEVAIAECTRVKELISTLQDFNRPTTGKFAPVDLHRIIEELLILSKKKLSDRRITVRRNFSPDLPMVMAVADQIKQVLLNIIANAEEAIGVSGGTISITTGMTGDGFVRIMVQDSGKGIRKKDLPFIFEPFFSTKPAVEGTGLGLSVSYGIVKRHGGEIIAESSRGKGTLFTITLPVVQKTGFRIQDSGVRSQE